MGATHAAAVVALNPLDPHSLLSSFGAVGVFLVLFAETGLLVGFFLPGDSLLFTAGLLCTTTAGSGVHLSLGTVLPAAVAGAVLGAQTGYLIGAKAGPPLLDRPGRPRLQQTVASVPGGAGALRRRQGHRPRPVHPAGAHRAEPAGRHRRGARAHVHVVAGARRRACGRPA